MGCPLNVEGFFDFPTVAFAGGINTWETGAAVLVHAFDDGVREAEGDVKVVEVGDDGGIVVGINDSDGLAGAIAMDGAEHDLVHAERMADRGGGESSRRGGGRGEGGECAVGVVLRVAIKHDVLGRVEIGEGGDADLETGGRVDAVGPGGEGGEEIARLHGLRGDSVSAGAGKRALRMTRV